MWRITDMAASSRNPDRVDLEVDGRSYATVSADVVRQLGLRVGGELSGDSAELLRLDEARLRTLDRAVRMLAARARSSRDLRRRLLQKGEPAHAVDLVIERLAAAGLLDDAEYARQFSRSKVTGAGFSRRRLQSELAKRGVEGDTATEAIRDVFEDESIDEAAILERVARKKLRTLGPLDEQARRRRLYAFLARRGYDSEQIRGVLDALLSPPDNLDAEGAS